MHYIYKVILEDGDSWWLESTDDIYESFGSDVVQILRYELVDETDVTME